KRFDPNRFKRDERPGPRRYEQRSVAKSGVSLGLPPVFSSNGQAISESTCLQGRLNPRIQAIVANWINELQRHYGLKSDLEGSWSRRGAAGAKPRISTISISLYTTSGGGRTGAPLTAIRGNDLMRENLAKRRNNAQAAEASAATVGY